MNKADGVIQILPAQREARVSGLHRLFHIRFEVVVRVEVHDLAARCHEIAHYAVAQVEHVHEQPALERRDFL